MVHSCKTVLYEIQSYFQPQLEVIFQIMKNHKSHFQVLKKLKELMKIITPQIKIFLLLSVVLLFSLIPSVFSIPENVIYGSSLFEKLPLIEAGNTTEFRIKLFYKSGPYTIEDLNPIIEIYPLSLAQYLTIKTESTGKYLQPITTVIIKGNITASPDIPAGKVSLVYYFSAKDVLGNSYRSSWSDSSPPIDIQNEQTLAIKQKLLEKTRQTIEPVQIVINYDDPPLKQFRSGIPSAEIKCKEGFDLVIKVSSGSPACVKPQSKQKLLERGWAV